MPATHSAVFIYNLLQSKMTQIADTTQIIFTQSNMPCDSIKDSNTYVNSFTSKDMIYISLCFDSSSSLCRYIRGSLVTPLSGGRISGPSYGGGPLRWGKNTSMNRQVSLSRVRDPAGADRLGPLQSPHSCHPDRGVSHSWGKRAIGVCECCRKWWRPATWPLLDRWCTWENKQCFLIAINVSLFQWKPSSHVTSPEQTNVEYNEAQLHYIIN